MTAFHHLHEIKAPFQILVPTLFKCVSRVKNSIKIPGGELPIRPKRPRFAEGQEGGHWDYSNGTDSQAVIDSLMPPIFRHLNYFCFGGWRWGETQWRGSVRMHN